MPTAVLTMPRATFINWVQEAVLPTHNSLELLGGLRAIYSWKIIARPKLHLPRRPPSSSSDLWVGKTASCTQLIKLALGIVKIAVGMPIPQGLN